jgi:hypothetical protein
VGTQRPKAGLDGEGLVVGGEDDHDDVGAAEDGELVHHNGSSHLERARDRGGEKRSEKRK